MSRQLWIYKTWLEVQSAILAEQHKFHIFNASESGACGVIARKHDSASMQSKENWFLLDDILSKWTTTTLTQACRKYLEARRLCQTQTSARYASSLGAQTGIVTGTGPSLLYPN